MILPDPGLTIWLYTPAADMRCQIDGLAALTTRKLQETPHNGALYVFTNRRRTLMKIPQRRLLPMVQAFRARPALTPLAIRIGVFTGDPTDSYD